MCITIGFAVIMYILVPLRTREDASILTSSIVWLYNLYLQWSALSSNNDTQCNPNFGNDYGAITAKIVCGCFFSAVALFTISAMTKKDGEDEKGVAVVANDHLIPEENDNLAPVADVEVQTKPGETKTLNAEEQNVFPIAPATIYF